MYLSTVFLASLKCSLSLSLSDTDSLSPPFNHTRLIITVSLLGLLVFLLPSSLPLPPCSPGRRVLALCLFFSTSSGWLRKTTGLPQTLMINTCWRAVCLGCAALQRGGRNMWHCGRQRVKFGYNTTVKRQGSGF